jgi:hypothetical protein
MAWTPRTGLSSTGLHHELGRTISSFDIDGAVLASYLRSLCRW